MLSFHCWCRSDTVTDLGAALRRLSYGLKTFRLRTQKQTQRRWTVLWEFLLYHDTEIPESGLREDRRRVAEAGRSWESRDEGKAGWAEACPWGGSESRQDLLRAWGSNNTRNSEQPRFNDHSSWRTNLTLTDRRSYTLVAEPIGMQVRRRRARWSGEWSCAHDESDTQRREETGRQTTWTQAVTVWWSYAHLPVYLTHLANTNTG